MARAAARVTRNACLVTGVVLAAMSAAELPASASPSDPGLGSATSYAVLATSTITNTGPSVIAGDVGLSPGTSITGFTPATVVGGVQQVANAAAAAAVADARTGYASAASQAGTGVVTSDLAGQDLHAGVYDGGTLSLSGQLTLDGQGSPDSIFILRSASTLVTATASSIVLVNGAQACHVFWQVGSSATLATGSSFIGTVLADASITAETGTTVDGRLLALDGAVTLDDDAVSTPTCVASAPTGGGSSSPTPTPTPTATPPTAAPLVTPTPTASPTATAVPTPTAPVPTTSTAGPVTISPVTTSPSTAPGATVPGATVPAAPGPLALADPAPTATPLPTETPVLPVSPVLPAALPLAAGPLARPVLPAESSAAAPATATVRTLSLATSAAASSGVASSAIGTPAAAAQPDGRAPASTPATPVSAARPPLAYTGDDVSALLTLSGLLMALGAALVTLARPRTR